MKMKLNAWARSTYAPGSVPCATTLYRMANNGDIPGAVKIGGLWYVEEKHMTKAKVSEKMLELAGDDSALLEAMGL